MIATQDSTLSAAVRGRSIGACVGAGFGALWGVMALHEWHAPRWTTALVVAIALALVVAVLRHASTGPARKPRPLDGTSRRRRLRGFLLVFVGEVVAMNIVAWWLLPRRPEFLVPAIATIVGLHFLPLAKVLGVARFRTTGLLMTVAGLAAICAMAVGADAALCRGIACLACALALWGTVLGDVFASRTPGQAPDAMPAAVANR